MRTRSRQITPLVCNGYLQWAQEQHVQGAGTSSDFSSCDLGRAMLPEQACHFVGGPKHAKAVGAGFKPDRRCNSIAWVECGRAAFACMARTQTRKREDRVLRGEEQWFEKAFLLPRQKSAGSDPLYLQLSMPTAPPSRQWASAHSQSGQSYAAGQWARSYR